MPVDAGRGEGCTSAERCSSSPPAATRTASSSLDDVAVERLADELDLPERRAALAAALAGLAADAQGFAAVTEMLAALRDDPELAWRTYALALLADELADDDR